MTLNAVPLLIVVTLRTAVSSGGTLRDTTVCSAVTMWDWTALTTAGFELLWKQSVEQYGAVIGTDDPDLTRFRDPRPELVLWRCPVCAAEEGDAGAFRLENEAKRFLRAPLVIAVISRVVKKPTAPEWEQVLSAGASCQNLVLAATALGYGVQWITEWYAYDRRVLDKLGVAANERIVNEALRLAGSRGAA